MRLNLATGSLLFFSLSVLLLLGLTEFESALIGLSPRLERVITVLLLVVPAVIGTVLGVMSLARKEGRTGRAMTGIILNGLFALFHLSLTFFAG